MLLVPDVRGLPYVFAKGVLEDFGFAWKVNGKVEGYAVNLVAEQSVEAAAKVLDTGAPTIVLRLKKNPNYEPKGLPEDRSPYPGTKLVLASDAEPATAPADESTSDEGFARQRDFGGAGPGRSGRDAEPAETEPAETEPTDAETADYEQASNTMRRGRRRRGGRAAPARFELPGAPPEPLDEMSLPERAQQLSDWVADLDKLTPAALDHFTYQHAWIVTGAEFGWWRGAEALRDRDPGGRAAAAGARHRQEVRSDRPGRARRSSTEGQGSRVRPAARLRRSMSRAGAWRRVSP